MGNRQGHDQDELDAIVTALEDLVARRSASTSPRHSGRLLGMLLVTRGYLVQSELEYALAWQERSGRRLGQVVVDLGLVREEEIVELLAEQHRLDVLDPAKIVIEPIFEADFEDTAYAYRPARGAVDAVKEVHRQLCQGYADVVDADVSRYLDPVSYCPLVHEAPSNSSL